MVSYLSAEKYGHMDSSLVPKEDNRGKEFPIGGTLRVQKIDGLNRT
jgi:hypothetical protein